MRLLLSTTTKEKLKLPLNVALLISVPKIVVSHSNGVFGRSIVTSQSKYREIINSSHNSQTDVTQSKSTYPPDDFMCLF